MSGTRKIPIGTASIGKEEEKIVREIMKDKRLSANKNVRGFEFLYANRLSRQYGIAVNSGSSANLVAILAMKEKYGWKDGDGVFVPACTFATVVMPVIQAGLYPIFVDVDEDANISYNTFLMAIQGIPIAMRVVGLVMVHSLGIAARDIKEIMMECNAREIRVLEDCCESHGAKIHDIEVGKWGDVSTTSFFVAHNMTTGEGGMIFTDDPEINVICQSLREFGRRIEANDNRWHDQGGKMGQYDIKYVFDRIGYNLRMTDLEAGIGIEQLKKLDKMNEIRRGLVTILRNELIGYPVGFSSEENRYNTYYAFSMMFINEEVRNKVREELEKAGVETRPLMGGNLLRQKAFEKYGTPEYYPIADQIHKIVLLVGCHPGLSVVDMRYIANIVKKHATL